MNDICIEINKGQLLIKGVDVTEIGTKWFSTLERISSVLGEPIYKKEGYYAKVFTWESLDIECYVTSSGEITNIEIPRETLKEVLSGKVRIDGKSYGKTRKGYSYLDEIKVDKSNRYGLSISRDSYYVSKVAPETYQLSPSDEETIEFTDFGFKLMVIEELMYCHKILRPIFDLQEFAASYEQRIIDLDEEGYGIIPEARKYFINLPIPKRFAKFVTSLHEDGSNSVYSNIVHYYGGYGFGFDVSSVEDTKHFPNLKQITLANPTEHICKHLENLDIKLLLL